MINDAPKNPLAQALGRMGKGKPKNYTEQELQRRRRRMARARAKRWPPKRKQKATIIYQSE